MPRPVNITDLYAMPRSHVKNATALAAIDRAEARRRAAFEVSDENLGDGVGSAVGGYIGSGGLNVGGSAVGQVQNAREVVIEIKGTISNVGMWFINEPQWIEQVLEARGWDIRVAAETQTPIGGIGTRTWRVTAMVGKQYNDSQIVTNARNHLADRGMTVASVAIVAASAATYTSGNANTSGGDGTNVGTSVNSMIAGAALGLGVSSTVLMLGGAAVLVLLLRRR